MIGTVIALRLGHADIRSTQAYLRADLTIKERAGSLTPGRSRPHPANRPVASYPATAAMEVISVTLAPADAAELAAMLQFLSDWLSRDRDHLEPPLESSSVLNP